MPSRRPSAIVFSIASLLAPLGAVREAAAREPSSEADALFQKGVDSMHAGDYATACPALDRSYALDPVPGALFTVAECDAAWGKLSEAVTRYQAFLELLPSLPPQRRDTFEERRQIAVAKLAALSAQMPEMTIDVPPGAPENLVVRRNGAAIESSALGVTQKVDPGKYVVTVEVPGGDRWERTLQLDEHSRARVEIPWPLHGGGGGGAIVSAPTRPTGASMRPWAYAVGAVGAAGILSGTVAGIIALHEKSTVDANCSNHLCNADGQSAVAAGRTSSTVSSVAFSIGVVGGVASLALLVLSSRPTETATPSGAAGLRPSIDIAHGGASISVGGAF